MMGHGGDSMFYLVAVFLVLYAVGMSAYLLWQKIRKSRDRRRNGNG